eukprot:COSAG05_NODE_1464_length_4807_cov_1081.654630_6_plen_205_part_00
MPASDDDAGIPLVFTARKPGYVPPKEYVQFLDMGGELARLFSLKDVKALKAAVVLSKNRSMAELGIEIDETGQADEKDRDKIDDMVSGNEQLVAALYDPATCRVDENRSVFHSAKLVLADQSTGALVEVRVDGHRAYNSDVGYDSQIVTSGGGVTRLTGNLSTLCKPARCHSTSQRRPPRRPPSPPPSSPASSRCRSTRRSRAP